MKTLLTIILVIFSALAFGEDIFIIVNEKNPQTEISASKLAHYYFKENRQWPGGQSVRFFDQKDESETRKIFLEKILKKTSREVELFWIGQKLYTGNRAPLQLGTDSMVASMVSRFPGAIGYVSANFTGAPGVKKIELRKE